MKKCQNEFQDNASKQLNKNEEYTMGYKKEFNKDTEILKKSN
jgi:hypothetical protein